MGKGAIARAVLIWAVICSAGPNLALGRNVTVADVVESTSFVKFGIGPDHNFDSLPSPDGKRFVVELKQGNIRDNKNQYSLLLFDVGASSSLAPAKLLTSFSSTNKAAIQNVQWLSDRVIAFLGLDESGTQQLFTLDCVTRQLTQLSHHSTDVLSYAISGKGSSFFFTAKSAAASLLSQTSSRHGILVSTQVLSDLISLRGKRNSEEHDELFKQNRNGNAEVLVQSQGINGFSSYLPGPRLSPDGRKLVIKMFNAAPPAAIWNEYQDRVLHSEILEGRFTNPLASYEFELIDAETGHREILLNAPTGFGHTEVAWSPDSKSVVISGTYLPLEGASIAERQIRRKKRFVVEISVSDGFYIPVTDQDLRLLQWDATTGVVRFVATSPDAAGTLGASIVAYRKTAGGWKRVPQGEGAYIDKDAPVKAEIQESINSSPKLVVKTLKNAQALQVFDPNPQFKDLCFGKVEVISFKTRDQKVVEAALYFPVGYTKGQRYPLVVQTHAVELGSFAIDGPYPTAFAAQPLAGRGIMVGQLKEEFSRFETRGEVTDEAATYESMIDYLDARGLIDSRRVGIIAFSRTGLAVEYALTHSSRVFAAATLADISDAGYFRYVALLNIPLAARDSEFINGGVPFGKGLASWVKKSPGFDLDKVKAPVWLAAQDPMSLFFEWEWFAGLTRLGKPVELIYMPEADHVLVRPWDRVVSQGGNVDWFDFWLNGHEDSDPAKVEQYRRWEKLCDLQVQQNPGRSTLCVRTKPH